VLAHFLQITGNQASWNTVSALHGVCCMVICPLLFAVTLYTF
jgi:hypothetical protein